MAKHNRKTSKRKSLAETTLSLLMERSRPVVCKAKEILADEETKCSELREALHQAMQEWDNIKHPGLLSIACETVGGNPASATDIGAALLLMLTAAHIHDDIIDQTEIVDKRPTILRKYGSSMALLTGDTLLAKGLLLLHEATQQLPDLRRKEIMNLVSSAFTEICCGEAKEAILRKNNRLTPQEYLEILKMRAAMGEVTMKIGAIMGNGAEEEVARLGSYGRTFGLLIAIRDEFADIFEPEELKSRFLHGSLPLPIMYAFQDEKKRSKITSIMRKKRISKKDSYMLAELVRDSEEAKKLKRMMSKLKKEELSCLAGKDYMGATLKSLMEATSEDL
jgi:geranylgeranyl pyrophosphate synthase